MAVAGAHRYWRLSNLYATPTTNWVQIAEVTLTGVEQPGSALSATASASTTYSSNVAANVVDNNTATVWQSSGAGPQWISFDLGQAKAVTEIKIYGPNNSDCVALANVDYSDNGSTWTNVITGASISAKATWATLTIEQAPPDPNAPQKTTLTLSLNSALFSNPGNVYAIDGQYSTGGPSNTNNAYNRYYTNATSVIPAGAQILGTEYIIRGRVNTTAYGARCDVSWNGFANAGDMISLPTTDTTIVRGGPTTVLGTPTLSDLGNLVMRYTQANSGGTTNWWVDYLGVNVYWKIPAAGNPLFFGENF